MDQDNDDHQSADFIEITKKNMASLLGRIISPQSHWTQADLYDAVFTLRIVLAGGLGLMFGLGSIEGLYAFLTYVYPSARSFVFDE